MSLLFRESRDFSEKTTGIHSHHHYYFTLNQETDDKMENFTTELELIRKESDGNPRTEIPSK